MLKVCSASSLSSCILLLVVAVAPVVAVAQPAVNPQPWEENSGEVSYSSEVRDALLAHYSNWAGTRHKLGGTSQHGVDCSSFIQTLFQNQFQLDLPRSSREQMTMGERVDVLDLRSGDLLFFKTGPTRRHVGVYLGENQFMHVSTRAGVEITKLLSPYWQRHFITARRVALSNLTPSN